MFRNALVKIISSQMIVPGYCQNLHDLVKAGHYRHVQSASAEINYEKGLVLLAVKIVTGQGCRRRFIDKPFHLKPCQKSCLSGGIALFIIKICRDADDGLVYGLPQKFLRVLL